MKELFINPLLYVKTFNCFKYLVAMFLFSWALPRKERFALRACLSCAVCIGTAALLPILTDNLWYVSGVFMTSCLMCTASVKVCFKANWKAVGLVGAAAFSAEHISSMLDSIVSLIWPELFSFRLAGRLTLPIFGNYLVWMVLVYGLLWQIARRKTVFENDTLLSEGICALLFVASLVVNLYINLIHAKYAGQTTFFGNLFEYLINILCSGFLFMVQCSAMRTVQVEKRLEMTTMLWEQAREQYQISKDNIDAINMKCHDLKHRLLAIKGAAEDPNFADIMEAINSYGAEIKTGNEVLDVIFQEKNFQCRKRGIQFVCIIDGSELDFMETTDLYVLFGNMIDNCIEAVSNLPEGEVKNIQVTVRREKGFVIIATENGYTGQLHWSQGRLKTSKPDLPNHGYGILSIENIVHKYGGRYSISTEQQIFSMNIVFPVAAKSYA